MTDNGWIKWNGGECPVDPDTRIEVRYRCSAKGGPCRARALRWTHLQTNGDITSYRVVDPS